MDPLYIDWFKIVAAAVALWLLVSALHYAVLRSEGVVGEVVNVAGFFATLAALAATVLALAFALSALGL